MACPPPPSFWSAVAPPPLDAPQLTQTLHVDCAVVGGGFTGLNAAWQLMKKGVQTCVLEANDAGWGASGRNGGMMVLRYKHGWAELAQQLGTEATILLYHLVHEAVDTIEENVRELDIDGGFSRCGHITAANTQAKARALQKDLAWLKTNVADTGPQFLSADQMLAHLGTTSYCGGYLDPKAGGINPLQYARELAAALVQRGLPIHAGTVVQRIETRPDQCVLHTPGGTVIAKTVVLATNAYSDQPALTPSLHRSIVPVNTSVVVTQALPQDIYQQILPGQQLVTDTRHLVNYFRRVPGNRILYGGRGSLTRAEHDGIYRGLMESLSHTFPVLRQTAIDYRWSGRVAITLNDFPHVGQHSERIFYALGYGGRGVALSHLLGKLVADMVTGTPRRNSTLYAPLRPIPLHDWRLPMLNLVALYFRLRDTLKI